MLENYLNCAASISSLFNKGAVSSLGIGSKDDKTSLFSDSENLFGQNYEPASPNYEQGLMNYISKTYGDNKVEEEKPKDSGKITDFYTIADGQRYYFSSSWDALRADYLTADEMKKLSVGHQSMELKGDENIKTNEDAVVLDKGKRSEFYIDIDNVRYYYSSAIDLANASLSINPSDRSVGKARIMTQWGAQTDYYIDYNGSRYYFQSETEKASAQKQLEEDKGVFGMLKFNRNVAGRS